MRFYVYYFILFLAILFQNINGTTYYVNPVDGNDNRAGTDPAQAWRSTQRVNLQRLQGGDKVLFLGGAVFNYANLTLNPSNCQGTATNPVVFSTYGSGNAQFYTRNTASAITILNTAGIEIKNLELIGSGDFLSDKSFNGIEAYVDLSTGIKLDYLVIDNVIASQFLTGISIGAWSPSFSGFQNVYISNVIVHDNRDCGLCTYGYYSEKDSLSHQNIKVYKALAYNNKGNINNKNGNTGNGIIISGCKGGSIEYSVAHHNGEQNGHFGGGPVGIWTWSADDIVIQYNIAYSNRNGATNADGGGFDIDGGARNCILQYNYSYDNDGPGYELCQFQGARQFRNNTIRWNISQNDSVSVGLGAFSIWSGMADGMTGAYVYDNTVYVLNGPGVRVFVSGGGTMTNVNINNNIFVTRNTTMVELYSNIPDLHFVGNAYWAETGGFNVQWNGKSYDSLNSWRQGTLQETLNGTPKGIEGNPVLYSVGNGPKIQDPSELQTISQYTPTKFSPVLAAGLNLDNIYKIYMGPHDFLGNPVNRTIPIDIGAVQMIFKSAF